MAKQKTQSKREPTDEVASKEQELAEYLQERIKPGLNRGSIPLLARSIAKEIVEREHLDGGSEQAEADEESAAEAGEDAEARNDAEPAEDEDFDEEDAEAEPGDEDADDAEAEADDDSEDENEDHAEAEADDDYEDEDDVEAEDHEPSGKGDDHLDFEDEMHELQAELGDDWILRFSVEGDDAWLTAEKKDGSQHVEAPTAEVLLEAVDVLEDGRDRSS